MVYSLARVKEQGLAEELHQCLREQEADYPDLAERFSEGPERQTRGQVGPVALNSGPAELRQRLRVSRPGQLWPPFQAEKHWWVMRFEQLIPAQLDARNRGRMIEELFQVWFKQRVQLLMYGEPLPPLPYLPPDEESDSLSESLEETDA